MRIRILLLVTLFFATFCNAQDARKESIDKFLADMIQRSTLAEPGSQPFYIRATLKNSKDKDDPAQGTFEEYWASPTKWKRVLKLKQFSQTRVVNGDKVFEENQGEYLPPAALELAESMIDPIPQEAVALFTSLGMQAESPGSHEGQCFAEKHYQRDDGKDSRALISYDCKTGLLLYTWTAWWGDGVFTDYKKFHKKMVAYATKDNPLAAKIESLRDLSPAEMDSVFEIKEVSPLSAQLRSRHLSEAAARKLLLTSPEVKWPNVKINPTNGTVDVMFATDRQGNVRWTHSYFNKNDQMQDAAEDAVRSWKFKPYFVDGVPTQIEGTLEIPYSFGPAAAVPSGPEAKTFFDKVRKTNSIRIEGGTPFHLKATFEATGLAEVTGKGTYEEIWVSPKKWWHQVNLEGHVLVEARDDDDLYRKFSGPYAARRADEMVQMMTQGLPGDNGADYYPRDWRVVETTLGALPATRLTRGYVTDAGKLDARTTAYFVDGNSDLRAVYQQSLFVVMNELQPFGDKKVARKVDGAIGGVKSIEAHVETLEAASNIPDETFKIAGVKPISFDGDDENSRFTQPKLIHQVKMERPESARNLHAKLQCTLWLDQHGHVRSVEFQDKYNEDLQQSAIRGLMQWEYEPATRNGRPVGSPTTVTIDF